MRLNLKKQRWQLGVLIVLTALSLWVVIPQHPMLAIGTLKRDLNIRLGLDLQGGAHLVYRANVAGLDSAQVADAVAGVRDVIERRVNAFGVAEPLIQTNRVGDEQRIIVELAGVYDVRQAIKQIGETPQLDFRRELTAEDVAKKFNVEGSEKIEGPVFERTELTGKHLKRATVAFDQFTTSPQVTLEFDSRGAELFAELTRQNLNKRIAIYLDGVPISAPVVQAEITDGQAVISGGFTLDEAKELAQRLTAGALPIPIELVGQQTVGPSLGQLSIQQSIAAGVLGLLAVVVFMIAFYRLPGTVASVALVLYALFFIALIKLIPITLTLAGIAGFILSIGMAVDANVLIFERLRENLRAGHPVSYSLTNGFKGAWSAIRASNVAGLITAAIMYGLGTSIIRGFALTLAIGILLSMFTAIVATRSMLVFILSYRVFHRPGLLAVRVVKSASV